MQKAHALFYRVRVVGNSMSVGPAKPPVPVRCGLTGEQGRRGVVAVAPALYPAHRVGDELGIAFAPSFRPRARANCEQACCSHSRNVTALVLPYSYWVADLRVVGNRTPGKEGERYLRNTP